MDTQLPITEAINAPVANTLPKPCGPDSHDDLSQRYPSLRVPDDPTRENLVFTWGGVHWSQGPKT